MVRCRYSRGISIVRVPECWVSASSSGWWVVDTNIIIVDCMFIFLEIVYRLIHDSYVKMSIYAVA